MRQINYKQLALTQRQKQFIIGTILGGSSLVITGKTPYLSMRGKNKQWLNFKASELTCIATANSILEEVTNRWHSICHPVLQEFYDKFYRNKQRSLQPEALEMLYDISFAVWFGDCGSYHKGTVLLNTNIWGQTGTEVAQECLDLAGFPCDIIKQRNHYRIRFGEASSSRFIKLVSPHLPQSLKFAHQ